MLFSAHMYEYTTFSLSLGCILQKFIKKTGILLFAAAIAFSGAAFAAELSTDNQAVLPVVQTEVKTTEETNTQQVNTEEAKAVESETKEASEEKSEEVKMETQSETIQETAVKQKKIK